MNAPYRADQVGRLLRPATLADARRRFKAGELDAAALRELEDRAIDEAVRRQESVGLRSEADYRRVYEQVEHAVSRRNNRQGQTGVHVPIVIKKRGRAVVDALAEER